MTSLSRARWYAFNDFTIRHGTKIPKHFTIKTSADVFTDPKLKKLPLHMKLYYMFPKPFMFEMAYRVENPAQSLDVLKKQILMARLEYWYRKMASVPYVFNAAVIELKYLLGVLRDPLKMNGMHLQWLLALAVHCFGFFLFGEMVGRFKIGGYGVVSTDWFSSEEGFRFSPVVW
ncbi:hypothetical protein MHBO_001457 [Bonamia ostreae]|uniref:Uncharacterized protein n=1 Tax=Bonamia ostreae TaxID=126728 RepID=A0ABV2AJ09_9EUKA